MLLMPTTAPGYVDVQRAALAVCPLLTPTAAHVWKVLALHFPEIRPTNAALAAAMGAGTTVRTVERTLQHLAEEGFLASLTIKRGVQRGGMSWRFLVLPTLTPIGDDPLLVGRGPEAWTPEPLRPGSIQRLTVATDGKWLPAADGFRVLSTDVTDGR